ncbi:MAG: hypothetical protein HC925_03725 [Coleofasciculaceae cyanobacterium SM2_3_26]|nr:hypothetical protein [Coleofasciculaceae cyanobacterium SM2_3_26]
MTFCQDAEIVSDVLPDFHATVFHATVFHATVFHATVAQILAAEDEV